MPFFLYSSNEIAVGDPLLFLLYLVFDLEFDLEALVYF